MPKLIPELRERIIAAAKVRVLQSEDHDFTTRQIAEDCGIAAGTVYNYFHNKEELLANVMLEDWKQCVERIGLSPDETEVQVAAELLLAASQRETGTLERILPVIRKILA